MGVPGQRNGERKCDVVYPHSHICSLTNSKLAFFYHVPFVLVCIWDTFIKTVFYYIMLFINIRLYLIFLNDEAAKASH